MAGTYASTYIPINQSGNEKLDYIIDSMLTPRLLLFRQIEVSDEQLRLETDRVTWKTLWGNILPGAPIVVNRAGERLKPGQFTVDNEFGRITFGDVNDAGEIVAGEATIPMSYGNGKPAIDVTANYVFDYFPNGVLSGFIQNALGIVNTAVVESAPTSYTVETFPEAWGGVLTDLAFALCMERLLLDYDLWKGRLIFAIGADQLLEGAGGDIVGQLTTLKQNSEQRAYRTLENPRFKAGFYVSAPTPYYWRAVYAPGSIGSSRYQGGRLRGWKPTRIAGR